MNFVQRRDSSLGQLVVSSEDLRGINRRDEKEDRERDHVVDTVNKIHPTRRKLLFTKTGLVDVHPGVALTSADGTSHI